MRLPAGRNVEIEGEMPPVGSSWAVALGYCAFALAALWLTVFVVREIVFIVVAAIFVAAAPYYLYRAMRATLDARAFGAMRLRTAAPPAAVGGSFKGSLRISESAAVQGNVRAELRCYQLWFDEAGKRREEPVWSEERSFAIRGRAGGSYAILEFPIPAGLPPTEAPPPTGGTEPGRRYRHWELQAIASSEGAFREERYLIVVAPAAFAQASAADAASLPMEIERQAAPAEVEALPSTAAAAAPAAFEISRRRATKPRAPRPVEQVLELAEPEVLPPEKPDRVALSLLVAANLVPLAGVAFFGWKVQHVVFLYWLENLVIGGFNVLRILALQSKDPEKGGLAGKLMLAAFFTVHYGGFCFGHGIFLASFFGRAPGGGDLGIDDVLRRLLHDPVIAASLVAMLVSHGWSFFRNYLGRGEYLHASGEELMGRPYKRIMVTHVFIIVGGFLIDVLKAQVLAMLLFIGLKIAFDVHFHRAEHQRKSAP